MLANGYSDEQVKVTYKRPTDLSIRKDVPIFCNLLIADLLVDDGCLTAGLIPGVRHSLYNLLTDDAQIVPSSVTVYCMAAEMRTKDVCGFDMSAVNRNRWHPSYLSGVAVLEDALVPLSELQGTL